MRSGWWLLLGLCGCHSGTNGSADPSSASAPPPAPLAPQPGASETESSAAPLAPGAETKESATPSGDLVDASEPSDAGAVTALSVQRLGGTTTAPNRTGEPATPPTLTLTASPGALRVTLGNFTFYCTPAPGFSASLRKGTIELETLPPEPPVSRCVGPHSAVLQIGDIPPGSYVVVVRSQDAEVVRSETIAIPGR